MKVVYRNYDGQEMEENDVWQFINWKIKSTICEGKSYEEASEQLLRDTFFIDCFTDKNFLKQITDAYLKKINT